MMPNYMQVPGLARALGATVRPWWLRQTGSGAAAWQPDLDELASLVTPATRAIVICNPNNPTGARLDAPVLDAVCRAAERVGAWVIGDEIYRGAERLADDTPSVWNRGYDRAVVTSGLSKAYGLPGLRIGWIVAPPDLVSDLWGVHDYTTIAPGALNDRLARVALEPSMRERLIARTRMIIRTNYPLLCKWADKHGLTHVPPDAGAIALVRYPQDVRSLEIAEGLRRDHSVLVVPGEFFEMDGWLRLGFGSDPAYLTSALTLIGEFLDTVGAHAR